MFVGEFKSKIILMWSNGLRLIDSNFFTVHYKILHFRFVEDVFMNNTMRYNMDACLILLKFSFWLFWSIIRGTLGGLLHDWRLKLTSNICKKLSGENMWLEILMHAPQRTIGLNKLAPLLNAKFIVLGQLDRMRSSLT